MTLTLELQPDVQRSLETKARWHGLPIADYLLGLAARDTQPVVETELLSDQLWKQLTNEATHNAAIIALASVPEAVRANVMQRSGAAAAAYYQTPEGVAEWEEQADWRAMD